MCMGLESAWLPLVIGGALSAGGAVINHNEDVANQERQVQARNAVLRDTLARNNQIAQDSRQAFQQRQQDVQPVQVAQQQGDAQATRAAAIAANTPTFDVSTIPGAADAPTIVKTALQREVTRSLDKAREKAAAQASLGSFGDLFQNMATADQGANDQVGTDVNFARANLNLLPSLQDFAAYNAYQPSSGLGSVLQGAGSLIGGAAGAGGLTNRSLGWG